MTALGLLDAPLVPLVAAADVLRWASDGTCNALEEDEKEREDRFLHARDSVRYRRAACTPRRERALQAIAD